jgi:hypothetical protein
LYITGLHAIFLVLSSIIYNADQQYGYILL